MSATESTVRIVDEMIEDGRLRYDADRDRLELGDSADIKRVLAGLPLKPKHRRRPTLLREPGYAALRERMLCQEVRADS